MFTLSRSLAIKLGRLVSMQRIWEVLSPSFNNENADVGILTQPVRHYAASNTSCGGCMSVLDETFNMARNVPQMTMKSYSGRRLSNEVNILA